jgi:hypothetical protein
MFAGVMAAIARVEGPKPLGYMRTLKINHRTEATEQA